MVKTMPYSQRGSRIMNIRDFDTFDPPAIGTRFDTGTTAIEYVGEFYFGYFEPSLDGDYVFDIINSEDGSIIGTLDDFERIDSAWGRRPHLSDFDGISFDAFNTGYLLLMSSDDEGCFLFRHWRK